MKFVVLIILGLFLNKSCEGQTKNDLKETVLEYTATSRGFYNKIRVQNQLISISNDRDNKEKIIGTQLANQDWNELIGYFNQINLDSLPLLKSPSKQRFHDGAAIAHFEITHKGKKYTTTSFDHRNPPEHIKKIVTKLNTFVKKNNED